MGGGANDGMRGSDMLLLEESTSEMECIVEGEPKPF